MAETGLLPAEVIEPQQAATASVIWLHGLGADGHDFMPIVPELGLDGLPIRFIFPHAPKRSVTVNMGYVMRAWYDIRHMDIGLEQDDQGTRESEEQIAAWIAHEEANGIPTERIILAGFSQGGAIALHTALRYPRRLGGIMALSTYLPLADAVKNERHQANLEIPIYMAHGTDDPIIPLTLAERSQGQLEALGHTVDWHPYPMQHSVHPQEVRDIALWLRGRLG